MIWSGAPALFRRPLPPPDVEHPARPTLAVIASAAFTLDAARIARFALCYGSLAAVAITLVGLWLVCLFLLVRAELNLLLDVAHAPGRAAKK